MDMMMNFANVAPETNRVLQETTTKTASTQNAKQKNDQKGEKKFTDIFADARTKKDQIVENSEDGSNDLKQSMHLQQAAFLLTVASIPEIQTTKPAVQDENLNGALGTQASNINFADVIKSQTQSTSNVEVTSIDTMLTSVNADTDPLNVLMKSSGDAVEPNLATEFLQPTNRDATANNVAEVFANQAEALKSIEEGSRDLVVKTVVEQPVLAELQTVNQQMRRLLPDATGEKQVDKGLSDDSLEEIVNPLTISKENTSELKVDSVRTIDAVTNISSATEEQAGMFDMTGKNAEQMNTNSFGQILTMTTNQTNHSAETPATANSAPQVPASEIHGQIVEQARLIKGTEDTQMVIKLKPEHLGELTLKVTVENGVVSASFHSDNTQVRNILETTLVQLKQELTNQGLKVDTVGVYGGLGEFFSDSRQSQPGQQGQNNRFKNRKIDLANFEDEVDKVNEVSLVNKAEEGIDYKI
ncbi:flagellar hook-length control protein FliK [Anaerosinus massiliensis]|uniref:flagellar hook-length control protein FliK n=1 Tax=Massilibacillus massiliensis TaxID=1806837 RepID=UPI000AAA9CE5|nr:flagellar hook-length control protein FliK [Massilibacillus massiliensis]